MGRWGHGRHAVWLTEQFVAGCVLHVLCMWPRHSQQADDNCRRYIIYAWQYIINGWQYIISAWQYIIRAWQCVIYVWQCVLHAWQYMLVNCGVAVAAADVFSPRRIGWWCPSWCRTVGGGAPASRLMSLGYGQGGSVQCREGRHVQGARHQQCGGTIGKPRGEYEGWKGGRTRVVDVLMCACVCVWARVHMYATVCGACTCALHITHQCQRPRVPP